MSPRINIEDEWFDDPRRADLDRQLGPASDGVALRMWRLAQTYFRVGRLVPVDLFERMPHWREFEAVGLAERRSEGVYIKGQSDRFDWLRVKQEAGRRGGQARADNARKQTQADSSTSKQTQPSSSSSSSENKEREPLSQSEIQECISEWGKTLKRHKISKSPRLDEAGITSLIQRYGFERTKLALLGAGFEDASPTYNPSKHVRISRLMRNPEWFDQAENLGSQHQSPAKKYADETPGEVSA
jgi:hypothetical protein